MSAIRIRANDNFSVVTTAISKRPWGDCKAQIQVKTQEGEFDLTMDSMSHLNILLSAFNQLLNDVNDENLESDQIRSRASNSNEPVPIIRKPLLGPPLKSHPHAHNHQVQQVT